MARGATMKAIKHKNGEVTIQLDEEEKDFLTVILARYNEGKGAMLVPANGFPFELALQLKGKK
jgi:hypothetical protein